MCDSLGAIFRRRYCSDKLLMRGVGTQNWFCSAILRTFPEVSDISAVDSVNLLYQVGV